MTRDDIKLLKFAAKAVGEYYGEWQVSDAFRIWYEDLHEWNPLADDGDAFRLAVKLGLLINCETCYYTSVLKDCVSITEHIGNDGSGCIYAATRRAIVRAAAEIGRRKAPQALRRRK